LRLFGFFSTEEADEDEKDALPSLYSPVSDTSVSKELPLSSSLSVLPLPLSVVLPGDLLLLS
jgi:hypothetical protein